MRGRGPFLALNRTVNPMLRLLLQSPVHRLVSGRFALITYTGRRSGRQYTIPVLNGELRAFDLSLVGLAAKLPGELGALGEPGGAERMALGDQPAGRIDHRAGAAVGGRLGLDQPVALALSSEPERLVGDQLVRGEAVVELADVDLLGRGARLFVGPPRRLLRHVIADDPDAVGVLVEARRPVGHP